MPKLNKQMAKKVGEAESGFDPLPEGRYRAKLMTVEVKDGKEAPYWAWTFEIVGEVVDGDVTSEGKGRRQWLNTSTSEKALWKMNEVFAGFGADPDTDTDELVGDEVDLIISETVIEQGKRKGEPSNNVESVLEPGGAGEDDPDWNGTDPF